MATAIFDPTYVDQFSATRYGDTKKSQLMDSYSKSYWASQQDKKRALADTRAQEAQKAADLAWQEGEAQKQRDFDTNKQKEDQSWAEAEAAKTRAWQEGEAGKSRSQDADIAKKAEKAAIVGAATQAVSTGAMMDMALNKGETIKGIYGAVTGGIPTEPGSFTSGLSDSLSVAKNAVTDNLPSMPTWEGTKQAIADIPGQIQAAPGQIADAVQNAPANIESGIKGVGDQITNAPGNIQQGVGNLISPVSQPAPMTMTDPMTGQVIGDAADVFAGTTGAIPSGAGGMIDASGQVIGSAEEGFAASNAAAAGGAAPTFAASMGTLAGGAAVVSLNKMLYDSWGKDAGDAGMLLHSVGRGAGTAAMASGIAGLAGTGIGAPVAAIIVAADVVTRLPETKLYKEAKEAITNIPLIGPIGDAIFFKPFEFASEVVQAAFGGVEAFVSGLTGGGSWFCTEVAKVTGEYSSEIRNGLFKLLKYGLKKHRDITRYYWYGAGEVVMNMREDAGYLDIMSALRVHLIDRLMELIGHNMMEEAFEHYTRVCEMLYRNFASDGNYRNGMKLVEA